MNNFSVSERETCDDETILFTAIAWTSKLEKNHYIRYPFVVGVDTAAQTNHENRPLFTVAVRSIDGK